MSVNKYNGTDLIKVAGKGKKGDTPNLTASENSSQSVDYLKSGNTVQVILGHQYTMDADSYIANFVLPVGFRPKVATYFEVATGGYSSDRYLARVDENGKIYIYQRDAHITYVYGSVTFIV